MFMHRVIFGSLLASTLTIAPAVHASSERHSEQCVFEQYVPSSISAYRSEEDLGYASFTPLRGAQIYVAAQPGLTPEWLHARVLGALSSHDVCAPELRNVQVSVVSSGPGFWITLSASNQRSADSLWRWAQTLQNPKKSR